MEDITYQEACMRAELLGTEKPDEDTFNKQREERLKAQMEMEEAAAAVVLETQDDTLKSTGGKLDELNTILSSTQKKLNRFVSLKTYGKIARLFGGNSDTEEKNSTIAADTVVSCTDLEGKENKQAECAKNQSNDDSKSLVMSSSSDNKNPNTKLDIEHKMTSHLDKLDTLISKAELAEISMSKQTTQMKRMK